MRFRKRYFKTKNDIENYPVPIVADATLATTGVNSGRLIPHLVLDTDKRPDIEMLLKMHEDYEGPGDVVVTWGKENRKSQEIRLLLEMKRPLELMICLEFNVATQGIIVDHILFSKGLYFQAGKPGQRIKDLIGQPQILLEIPHTGFQNLWNKTWEKALVKKMKKEGLSRKQAIESSKKAIEKMREMYNLRM